MAERVVVHGLGAGQAGLGELGFGVEHVEVLAHAVAVAAPGAGEGVGGLGNLLLGVVVAGLAELHVVHGLPHVGANLLLRILGAGHGAAGVGEGFHALVLILVAVENRHRELHHAHGIGPNLVETGQVAVFGSYLRAHAQAGHVAALHEALLEGGGGFGIAGHLYFGAVFHGLGQLGIHVHRLGLEAEPALHRHIGLAGLVQQSG